VNGGVTDDPTADTHVRTDEWPRTAFILIPVQTLKRFLSEATLAENAAVTRFLAMDRVERFEKNDIDAVRSGVKRRGRDG
jgi:hypothetical protein